MKHNPILKIITAMVLMMVIAGSAAYSQPNGPGVESTYKIKQVFVPEERRPPVEYRLEQVPFKNAGGQLPTYEGENFQINVNGQYVKSQDDAKKVISTFLESLKSPLRLDKDMRLNIEATTAKSDGGYIDEQIRIGKETTKGRIQKEMLNVSTSSDNMLNELGNELKKQSNVTVSVYRFDQYFEDVMIDNTAVSITNRNENEIVSLQGKFYNTVKPTNGKSLPLKDATAKAMAQIRSENKIDVIRAKNIGEIVLLPYDDGFKYVWKTEITAEGDYQVWIDADSGKVLQLFPLFFFDNAKGLAFYPDPNSPTREMTFDVDASSNGVYTLKNTGVVTLANVGTDGTSGIVTVPDDGSGTANFNISPINGTTVERTSQTGYNGLFQQVNIYAHIFNERKTYMLLGSQDFGQVNVTFNKVGGNSFCCPPAFHIGDATTSASTLCNPAGAGVAVFNAGCDGTVIAHEFGHRLNGLQYGVGGGSMTGAINEGLADFWACTNFNTNVFAGWWGHNCAAPTQSGWCPRASESLDVFPEHKNLTDASNEVHSAGQIVSWAQWSSRQGMNDAFDLGTLSINMNTIKAMTTAGVGVLLDGTDKSIHDSYLNLLKQLAPLYKSSRLVHKLLAGYARAGIFLSPKDAIVDIDHSYLNRASAAGPVFTVWTGDDYTFSGSNVVTGGILPFNTEYQFEVANDEAFTMNHITSAWLGGVVSAAGGTVTYAMPVADWNTLKSGSDLFYKVTTRDAAGGNLRSSLQPGNNFLAVNVPSGRAAINGTGTKDCSCTASASNSSSKMALIPLLPLLGLIVYRRRKTITV